MLTDADPRLVEELVLASHILAYHGVVDGFGHVSARRTDRPDRFLLSRNRAPEQVSLGDILEYDLASNVVTAGEHRVFLERFIHGEIYAARPDVMAVVHSHSHAVIPLGVAEGQTLRSVFHMGGFIGASTPIFEIRDVCGDGSDLLIRDRKLGRALAASLADKAVVLMRGHGSTAVGTTLRQAVFRAIYAEINAQLQTQASRLGRVTYLTDAESAAAAVSGDSQINRAWDLWVEQVRRGAD